LLEAQRPPINHYATMKDWMIAEFFVEIGVSGSIPLAHRPEGQRLLATLEPGAFRAVADALDALEQPKGMEVALQVVDLGGRITGNAVRTVVLKQHALNERACTPDAPLRGSSVSGARIEEDQ
jgi:putative DNA-invertase from lambdoid prophage Rac